MGKLNGVLALLSLTVEKACVVFHSGHETMEKQLCVHAWAETLKQPRFSRCWGCNVEKALVLLHTVLELKCRDRSGALQRTLGSSRPLDSPSPENRPP